VTATATTVQRRATSCDFVFTIATATVMQLRPEINTFSISFQTKNLPFLQILPTAASLFFFRTDYMIPQTFTVTSEHIRFNFFSFSVLHFLTVVSER